MIKHSSLLLILMVMLAGCAPAEAPLPTLAPTITPSSEPPTATPTDEPTAAPTVTETATSTHTPTITATASATLTPSATFTPSTTPTVTINPTVLAAASATSAQIQRPVFSTLTPAPPGAPVRPTSASGPQVVADVIITEAQFQDQVNMLLSNTSDVAEVEIDFTPAGVQVILSASGGQAIASGTFTVYFDMSAPGFNNLLTVYTDSPEAFRMVGGLPPSEAFINVAYLQVVPAIFESFNTILNQRLGEGRHDLENLLLTDREMLIILYAVVP